MRIHIMGRHAHRTPFSYAAYKEIFKRNFTYTDNPSTADVLIFGYVINIDEMAEEISALIKQRPALRLLVVSEEPLWDTTNSGDFRKRHGVRKTSAGEFRYSVINHHTSAVYEFNRFPYFLTTDNKFYLRYSRLFARNSAIDAKKQLAIWQKASIRRAFFAENRDLVKKYSVAWPEQETWGLSVYRTDVAKKVPDNGTLRVGQGWGSSITRQALPDWHLDKLSTLRGNSAVISAIENTCQRNYISEKIFDAYAAQGIPLYWAHPSHRVGEFAAEGSFVNLFGLNPDEAVKRISAIAVDISTANRYIADQIALRERFRPYDAYIQERIDFSDRISSEVLKILSE